jgi:hypothetical protein
MRALSVWLAVSLAASALAQTGVGVEVDDVTDNRLSPGMMTGSLDVRVKLKGTGLERATAARVVVKEAKDDRGTPLTDEKSNVDFTPRDQNGGVLQLSLRQPVRAASSVRVKGTAELFVPGRDPASIVKIEKALAHLDAPLSAKTLKAEKIEITPMSANAYKASMKARKITDEDVKKIRAEGKAHGASDKEIEMVIGMAKAMEAMDADAPEGAVILSGTRAAFDRIFRIEVLGADGKPMDLTERSLSTRGDDSVMTLKANEKPPQNASLQIYVLTDKARVSFPFELTVPLP